MKHPRTSWAVAHQAPAEPEADGVTEVPDPELDMPAKKTSTKKPDAAKPTNLSEDWTSMFWQLANRYELDKEQAHEVLVKHDNNFHHAYEALKASLEPDIP